MSKFPSYTIKSSYLLIPSLNLLSYLTICNLMLQFYCLMVVLQITLTFLPGELQDRRAWWAKSMGSQRVGHD